jgi:hypothetical protein
MSRLLLEDFLMRAIRAMHTAPWGSYGKKGDEPSAGQVKTLLPRSSESA